MLSLSPKPRAYGIPFTALPANRSPESLPYFQLPQMFETNFGYEPLFGDTKPGTIIQ